MKKSYKFDTGIGIFKGECASVKRTDLQEYEKLQEMELPNGTPSLVYEPAAVILDFSVNPIIQITEDEIPLYSEDSMVKVTEVLLISGEALYLLVPFEDFEKFFIEYKRIKFE
jgi:hypothetical protein